MPNWCFNNLSITVKTNKQLEKVIQGITGNSEQELDFNRVIPMPEELRNTKSPNKENEQEMIAKYGHADWYSWSCSNWGTKWNASSVDLNLDTPQHIHIRFDTAWSPPYPVISKIAETFPFASIEFTWEEESGFWGRAEYEDGAVISEAEGEIDCEYRWEHWGDCVPECESCGECDCEVCNCFARTRQTLCENCNEGNHPTTEPREVTEDEES